MEEFVEKYLDIGLKNNSDLEVVTMGTTCYHKGESNSFGKRYYHILFFVTSGDGVFCIDGIKFNICSGSVLYIPAGLTAECTASEMNPLEYSWVSFTGNRSAGFRYSFFITSYNQYVINGINTKAYSSMIKKSLSLKSNSLSSYLRVNSILFEIFAELSEECSLEKVPQGAREHAVKAKSIIDRDYYKKIQVQQIAGELGVHPYYLSRVFKDAFGISPKKYIMDRKFSNAMDKLSLTDMPVSDISASLGFDDQLSFSKAFKIHSGCSPTEFRKRHQKTSKKDGS